MADDERTVPLDEDRVDQWLKLLLDQAKEELSARLESARDRIRAGASDSGRGRPTE